MKAVKYLLAVLGVLLFIIVATPFLIPADQIRQVVEEEATKAAGMPVKIESLSVSLYSCTITLYRSFNPRGC